MSGRAARAAALALVLLGVSAANAIEPAIDAAVRPAKALLAIKDAGTVGARLAVRAPDGSIGRPLVLLGVSDYQQVADWAIRGYDPEGNPTYTGFTVDGDLPFYLGVMRYPQALPIPQPPLNLSREWAMAAWTPRFEVDPLPTVVRRPLTRRVVDPTQLDGTFLTRLRDQFLPKYAGAGVVMQFTIFDQVKLQAENAAWPDGRTWTDAPWYPEIQYYARAKTALQSFFGEKSDKGKPAFYQIFCHQNSSYGCGPTVDAACDGGPTWMSASPGPCVQDSSDDCYDIGGTTRCLNFLGQIERAYVSALVDTTAASPLVIYEVMNEVNGNPNAQELGDWHHAVGLWIRARLAAYETRDGVPPGTYNRLLVGNVGNQMSVATFDAVFDPAVTPAQGGVDLMALHAAWWASGLARDGLAQCPQPADSNDNDSIDAACAAAVSNLYRSRYRRPLIFDSDGLRGMEDSTCDSRDDPSLVSNWSGSVLVGTYDSFNTKDGVRRDFGSPTRAKPRCGNIAASAQACPPSAACRPPQRVKNKFCQIYWSLCSWGLDCGAAGGGWTDGQPAPAACEQFDSDTGDRTLAAIAAAAATPLAGFDNPGGTGPTTIVPPVAPTILAATWQCASDTYLVTWRRLDEDTRHGGITYRIHRSGGPWQSIDPAADTGACPGGLTTCAVSLAGTGTITEPPTFEVQALRQSSAGLWTSQTSLEVPVACGADLAIGTGAAAIEPGNCVAYARVRGYPPPDGSPPPGAVVRWRNLDGSEGTQTLSAAECAPTTSDCVSGGCDGQKIWSYGFRVPLRDQQGNFVESCPQSGQSCFAALPALAAGAAVRVERDCWGQVPGVSRVLASGALAAGPGADLVALVGDCIHIYRRLGGDRYADSGQVLGKETQYGAALADLDGNGTLDLLAAGDAGVRLYAGGGDARLRAIARLEIPYGVAARRVAAADLGGSGTPGIVAWAGKIEVWLPDGSGGWTHNQTLPIDSALPAAPTADGARGPVGDFRQLVLADLDGDARPEIVLGHRVYWNDGTGRFTDSPQRFAAWNDVAGVAAAEVDGRNGPDLVVAEWVAKSDPVPVWTRLKVFVNNGDRTFMLRDQRDLPLAADGIAVADFDLDGRPDVVLGNAGSAGALLLADLTQALAAAAPVELAVPLAGVLAADLNGDRAADLSGVDTAAGRADVLLGAAASATSRAAVSPPTTTSGAQQFAACTATSTWHTVGPSLVPLATPVVLAALAAAAGVGAAWRGRRRRSSGAHSRSRISWAHRGSRPPRNGPKSP